MWISLSIFVRVQISSISPGLSEFLEGKIGRHVDPAPPRALRPEIREGIYRDVVYA
jgi:hypothetical protein